MALFLNMRAVILLLIALFSHVNSLEARRRSTPDGALRKPVIVNPPIGPGPPELDWTYIRGSEPEAANQPGGAPVTNFGGVNVDEILEPGEEGAGEGEAAAQQEIAVLERLIGNSEKILEILPEKKKRLEELRRKIGADEKMISAEGDAAKLEQLTKLLKELDIKITEQEEALVESKETRAQLVEAIRKLKEALGKEVMGAGEAEKPLEEGTDEEGTAEGADEEEEEEEEEEGAVTGEFAGVTKKEKEEEEEEDEDELQETKFSAKKKPSFKLHSKAGTARPASHFSDRAFRLKQRLQQQSHSGHH